MNDSEKAPPRRSIWKDLAIAVAAGLISSTVITTVAYLYLKDNIPTMVAEGLFILDVQETSGAFSDISSSCRELTAILDQPTTRPAKEVLASLRASLKDLKTKIASVKTTEYYSVQELRQLAERVGFANDRQTFLDKHIGKPKRVVMGLAHVNPLLASIEELIESLDRQMNQESHVDLAALRERLAIIATTSAAAQAGLEARQSATLQTLELFQE